jgi:hypothetical protein
MPDPFGLALGSTPESEYCKYNLSFRKVPKERLKNLACRAS